MTKRSLFLKSIVSVICPGASDSVRAAVDDARAAGDRRQLRRDLRERRHAAVGKRCQLDMHLLSFAHRDGADEAHRAVEEDREVDLVVTLGHLDHVHQAQGRERHHLRLRPGRGYRGEEKADKAGETTLSA